MSTIFVNSAAGISPATAVSPMKKLGVLLTPARTPRPASASMSTRALAWATHARCCVMSSPAFCPADSNEAVGSFSCAHCSCVAKSASWNAQNFRCDAAHMAASAAGCAFLCIGSGKLRKATRTLPVFT